jgi:hypothetical protein
MSIFFNSFDSYDFKESVAAVVFTIESASGARSLDVTVPKVYRFPITITQAINVTRSTAMVLTGNNIIRGIDATAFDASDIIADARDILRQRNTMTSRKTKVTKLPKYAAQR